MKYTEPSPAKLAKRLMRRSLKLSKKYINRVKHSCTWIVDNEGSVLVINPKGCFSTVSLGG
jgi:hypothetical protein